MNSISKLILLTSLLFASKLHAQTERFYTDQSCKFIYCELTSSKMKIFYGNDMQDEIEGKPELLIATVTNLFLENNYQLQSVLAKNITGSTVPGYLFFVRKEEVK